ncbi:LuxR family transcriptional regulator [Cellulomonas sp. URHD0024]|uniref:helix-turn-helix transcriptional regulator n=1 Tax=Cellulomonas sp. URHD0024 TaxID=1302620 RepID=UPI00041A23F5|nr:LuxR family transcriptional regulator [Cellulomonas sp. URHD0024]
MVAGAEHPSSTTVEDSSLPLPKLPAVVQAHHSRRRTMLARPVVDQVRAELASGRSVLVVGDAGVGKTHLVTAALGSLRLADESVPHVVTISGASARGGIPLGALEPLLGDDALVSLGSVARTVDAVAASLRGRARGGALVLRVEDAHLLDTASAQALGWMVQQGEVQLVATARASAVAGSPWLELWKDDVVERVDVPAFTLAEVEHWLIAELGGQVSLDTVRRVWAETSGNAFHLSEVIRADRLGGALRQVDGVWVWTGRATPGRRLLDLVAHDMALLSADARAGLEVASLACPIPLSALLDLVPRHAVDELTRVGLVSLTPRISVAGSGDVLVDLAHALYAEAVRSSIPRAQRREVLLAVAELTHDGQRSGPALMRSVSLSLDCDMPVDAPRLRSAIDAAFEMQQPDTAVRIVTAALRRGLIDDVHRIELLVERADAWWHMDETAHASRDLAEAIDSVRVLERPTEPAVRLMVAATAMQAAIAHYQDGDLLQALVAFGPTEWWLDTLPAGLALIGRRELDIARLTRLGYAGRADLDAALAVLLSPSVAGMALSLACPTILGLAQSGRFRDAHRVAARYAQLAAAHRDRYRWAVGEVAVASFLATVWSGDLASAEASALAGVSEPALDWVATHVTRGIVGIAQGSWSSARNDLHAASARLGLAELGGVSVFTQAAEAVAAAASGDGSVARGLLSLLDSSPLRSMGGLEPEVRLLRLDALLWMRDPRATAEAVSLASWAAASGLDRIELEALHRCVDRHGRGQLLDPAVLERVSELAQSVDGPRAEALVAHVSALALDDPDLIRIAERALNRCGLWLPPLESPVALTRREQEIAALAAGGMTSRAIALRLTLSVRTVDSHLARVFTKTGVHSREGLSVVLR